MIQVLRLGHRAGRDDRISTHVGLTGRQWGAETVIYSGEKDESMMESLEDTIERWGGDTEVKYEKNFRKVINNFEGMKIHLTMYGRRLEDRIEELEEEFEQEYDENIMVIVGAEKVPRSVYRKVDFNISIGNQPHSEIAALAVFMDRFLGIEDDFEGAEIEVEPSTEGKKTNKL